MIIKSLPLPINCISFGSAHKGWILLSYVYSFDGPLCECTCHFRGDPKNLRFTHELENKLVIFPNITPKLPKITLYEGGKSWFQKVEPARFFQVELKQ